MAILEINNVKKSFGSNEVLKGISFSLEEGEVLSIIGSSGSGKTTLLRCMNFLETADCGTFSVDGKVIFNASDKAKLSDKEIRKNRLNFGLVFQDFNLFPQYSVFENLVLAPKLLAKEDPHYKTDKKDMIEEIEQKALTLLEKVGLSEKKDAYPCELSGGQKQRIALARALCVSPKFLIADEPTSALDVSVQLRMLQLIKELKREMGLTILFISHDMGVIYDICDEVAVMKDGKIEETGEKKAFFENPKTEYGKLLLDSVPTLPYLE